MSIVLTSENYAQYINEDADAIIDFSATWCGPCKRMKPNFESAESFMKSIKSTLAFLTVDVDNQDSIARDYDIESMPTIIIIKTGKIVQKIEGFMTTEKILMNIGKHFDIPSESTTQGDKDPSPARSVSQ